ncbi:class I SAM-dependent methyltransferase [Phormidium sp. CCY1219]|uniref:class I SAM-dependent methyltransferase n=1 Tax=Phormidium sp. CCY1219 TaxID=2886104 RepID=UPI002D1E5F8B|nr:class I SAM-dependent methyltransferase [Phormidium sp. CCY1219]MEB3827422.1 class I SAM-dependent methyltransferase [Phormidium sp. CCY1219]
MTTTDKVWKKQDLSTRFLEGVRGAVPLADEQIQVMLKIVGLASSPVRNFLDLGCGDGILGRSLLAEYPQAKGVFLDFSEPMIEAAKSKLSPQHPNVEFIIADFAQPHWAEAIAPQGPFDAIVSGFAIHHQSDEIKRVIYGKIYELLTPGGIFLNLEHVSSPNQWIENLHDEFFLDSIYRFHQSKGSQKSREELAQEYYHRPDKAANILAPMETQCEWLRTIGFVNVDCFFKLFELAIFGGMKSRGTKVPG